MPDSTMARRAAREDGQPDVNPARLETDALLAEIAELVADMDLYIGRHQYKQLTTRQKELWADLVDAASVRQALTEDEPQPRRTVRWWRDYRRPIGEEGHAHGEQAICRGCGQQITWDADIEKFWIPYPSGNPMTDTFHCVRGPLGEPHWALPAGADEPDPFLYDDDQAETGTAVEPRAHGDQRPVEQWGDDAAAQVARHALLDVVGDPTHPERVHLGSDFAALYDWAKAQARSMRMTIGERPGQIGNFRSYPSATQARDFLAQRRAARS